MVIKQFKKIFGGWGGVPDGRDYNPEDEFEALLYKHFADRVKADDEFACALWSSLTNIEWINEAEEAIAEYSFRSAGDLVAAFKGKGDYMDWYMCGDVAKVHPDILDVLTKAGWKAF